MVMSAAYEAEPAKETVDKLQGATVIEFGTNWCGYCQAAQPAIQTSFAAHTSVRHIKVEDGKGRPLGRAFGVKLWPTLVFLRDGTEVARVVRPTDSGDLDRAFAELDAR